MRIAPLPEPEPEPEPEAEPEEPPGSSPAAGEPEPPPVAPPPPLASAITATLSNRLPLYYVIGHQPVRIGEVPATRVDSAFAFTSRGIVPQKGAPIRKGDIPVVMRAIDVVLLRGTDALTVQVAVPIEDFDSQRPVLEAIVASLQVDPATIPPDPPSPPAEVAATTDGGPRTTSSSSTGQPDAPGAGPGVTVTGQVVDADSGLAVPGAIVVFLAPGTTVADVNDENLTQIAYTTGLADSSGHFASNRGLTRPGRYGVLVVADGYRWVGSDDGVSMEPGTGSPLNLGTVPLRRR